MSTWLYVEVQIICICLFSFILFQISHKTYRSVLERKIRMLIYTGSIISLTEIFQKLVEDAVISVPRPVMAACLVLYFSVAVLNGPIWLYVAETVQQSELPDDRRLKRAVNIITAVIVLFIVTTPWTHLVFHLDEQGILQQDVLFFPTIYTNYVYFMASTVRAVLCYKKTDNVMLKRGCMLLILYMIFPLAFGTLEVFARGYGFVSIGYSFGCLFLYFGLQSQFLTSSPVWGQIIETVDCGVFSVRENSETVVNCNKYAAVLLDLPELSIGLKLDVKQHFIERMADDSQTDIEAEYAQLRDTGVAKFRVSLLHRNGKEVILSVSVKLVQEASGETFLAYSLLDLSAVEGAREASKQTQKIITVMSNIYFCNYYIDLRDRTYVEISSLDFLRTFLAPSGNADKTFAIWRETSVVEEFQGVLEEFQQLDSLSARIGEQSALSIEFRTKRLGWCQGLFIPVDYDEDGNLAHVLWVAREINEEKMRQEQTKKYQYMYKHDALTGLFNRYGFNESVNERLAAKQGVSMLLLDIDWFKNVNDTYGHDNGDIVLRAVADMLREVVGADGLICRWGGEEFTVLLDADKNAPAIAEELRSRMESKQIGLSSATISVTISIGVCIVKENEDIELNALMRTADECLYSAKQSGKNLVVCKRL